MIKGIQALFYSSEANELGTFFREKFELTAIDNQADCLVFDIPKAQLVSHPSLDQRSTFSGKNHISFCCDDIEQTVKELKEKGVEFKGEILDYGYGLTIFFKAPGDFYIQLLQPK